MSEFVINLLDWPADAFPTLEKYSEIFLDYDPAQWNVGSGGGSFVYFDDARNKWSLAIIHADGLGFSLLFHERLASKKRSTEFISVGSPTTMNDFCSAGNDIWLPHGSFLPPIDAWKAAADFITTPKVKSNRVSWIPSSELNWPEM